MKSSGLEETLGPCIRRFRREKGYSLNQLAKRSGISNAYLSRIERALDEPSHDILSRILAALDISVTDLPEPITNSARTSDAQHPETETHPKCLIIEPDPNWQSILTRLLTDEDFCVEVASDRETALEFFKTNTYDLISLDLTLDPERRFYWGSQLLEHLKTSGYKIPPVIIISGTENIDAVIDVFNHYPIEYFARKSHLYQSVTRRELREIILRIVAKAIRTRKES